jgi:hypothetical protein
MPQNTFARNVERKVWSLNAKESGISGFSSGVRLKKSRTNVLILAIVIVHF